MQKKQNFFISERENVVTGINCEKNRIAYIDTAKACLIVLVILGHVLIILNPGYDKLYLTVVQAFIYSFHMPAFFLIHGVLFRNEKWKGTPAKAFIRKRLYTCIVPYLFFEVIGILWKAIFLKESLLKGFWNMLTVRCNVGADWFLPALFMGSLLFLIYVKHPNRIYRALSLLISFLLPMFLSGCQFAIVMGRGLLAYGFIMLGHLGKEFFLSEKTRSVSGILISLLVTGAAAVISLKWAGNDFYGCIVRNPIVFVVGGISGTFLVLGVSQYLQNQRMNGVGRHTLTIMGTHQLAIYALTALKPELRGGSILWGFGLLIAIIAFEIPTVSFIDTYLPFFVGKGKDYL